MRGLASDRLHREPAAAVADRGRLDRHDRRRGRDRAADQGVGREPVPHPVVVDGADAALREAGATAARRDSPTACSRTASSTTSATRTEARSSSSTRPPARRSVRRRRRLRQADHRPARRHGHRCATRLRLDQRQAARRAVHRRPARTRESGTWQRAQGRLLRHGRQPPRVVRLRVWGPVPREQPDRQGLRDSTGRRSASASRTTASGAASRPLAPAQGATIPPGPPGLFSMPNVIDSLEQRQLRTDLPQFKAG